MRWGDLQPGDVLCDAGSERPYWFVVGRDDESLTLLRAFDPGHIYVARLNDSHRSEDVILADKEVESFDWLVLTSGRPTEGGRP